MCRTQFPSKETGGDGGTRTSVQLRGSGQCGFSNDKDITDRLREKDGGEGHPGHPPSDGTGGWERPSGSVSFLGARGSPRQPCKHAGPPGLGPRHPAQQHNTLTSTPAPRERGHMHVLQPRCHRAFHCQLRPFFFVCSLPNATPIAQLYVLRPSCSHISLGFAR